MLLPDYELCLGHSGGLFICSPAVGIPLKLRGEVQ